MMEQWLLSLLGILIGVSLPLAFVFIQKKGKHHRVKPQAAAVYECVCGKRMTLRQSHRFVSLMANEELEDSDEGFVMGGGEGTGMSADYCDEHCPGGCNKGCEVRV